VTEKRDERYEIELIVKVSGFGSAMAAERAAGDLAGEIIDDYGYVSGTGKRTVYSNVDGKDIREF